MLRALGSSGQGTRLSRQRPEYLAQGLYMSQVLAWFGGCNRYAYICGTGPKTYSMPYMYIKRSRQRLGELQTRENQSSAC